MGLHFKFPSHIWQKVRPLLRIALLNFVIKATIIIWAHLYVVCVSSTSIHKWVFTSRHCPSGPPLVQYEQKSPLSSWTNTKFSSRTNRFFSYWTNMYFLSEKTCIFLIRISAGKIPCWRKIEESFVVTCNPSCRPKTICLTMNLKVNGFSNCSQNTRFVDMNRSNKLYSINLTKSYKVLKI